MAKAKKKDSKKKFLIGVDLGGTNVRAGLVSENKVLKLAAQTIRNRGTEKEVFEDLCSAIDSVFDKNIKGLGIGVPSLVNRKDGVVLDTTNIPSWQNVPLRKRLEKRYAVPVRINNDANCFALGEKYYGQGKKSENFVGLIIGTGLGAGIISRDKLCSGLDCGAGEFGLIPYKESIIEHYASGQFFQKFNWDGATLFQEAQAGNRQALDIFKQYGKHLAHAVKIVLYSVAPEMIVLGGSVANSYPYFQESLHESLKDFAYPTILEKLKLTTSKLKDVAVLGAASLVTDEP